MPGEQPSDEELSRGLVLHLNPDVLSSSGATFSCPSANRVMGGHFFLCVEDPDEGGLTKWVPLFTADNEGRIAIDTADSVGHAKVTEGTFHFHPGQVWAASGDQIRAAAAAGGDLSRTGSRNRLSESRTPRPPFDE